MSKKLSKFEQAFSEPNCFSDGSWVISGSYSREEASEIMTSYMLDMGDIDEPIDSDELKEDRVRYGFAPENVENMQGEACWYTGATGNGSKKVWVL